MEPFRYSPLPAGEDTVRMLRLLPGGEADEIQCELGSRNLAEISDHKTYEALSYCWGKPGGEVKISILEEGQARNSTILVQPNLHGALSAFRYNETPRNLWIDAVCIDQNNTKEKNRQIPLMRRIYEGCSSVVIWLGRELPDCNSEVAISLLKKLNNAATIAGPDIPNINIFSSQDLAKYGLPSLFSFDYVSLLSLLEAPWFHRSWIVQEAAVAKKATLFLGAFSADWTDLIHGMDFALKTKLAFTSHPAVNYFIPVADECAIYRAGGCTLLGVLLRHRLCGATNERDKVYAFLGLTEKSARPQARIKVDYGQDLRTVYTDVARSIITHDRNLDVLSLPPLKFKSKTKSLPSWVPDWSIPDTEQAKEIRQTPGSHTQSLVNAEEAGNRISKPFNAARNSDYNVSEIHSTHQAHLLPTRGHKVATITAVGDMHEGQFMPSSWNFESFRRCIGSIFKTYHTLSTWESVAELQTQKDKYENDESNEDAYWQTLIAGNLSEHENEEKPKQDMREEFFKWRQANTTNPILKKLGLDYLQLIFMAFSLIIAFLIHKRPQSTFHSRLQNIIFRRMIRTEGKRHIGMASGDVRLKDEVWLLEGSKVPLIIRREGKNGVLIGDAYIHGIMYGEAFMSEGCETLILE